MPAWTRRFEATSAAVVDVIVKRRGVAELTRVVEPSHVAQLISLIDSWKAGDARATARGDGGVPPALA